MIRGTATRKVLKVFGWVLVFTGVGGWALGAWMAG